MTNSSFINFVSLFKITLTLQNYPKYNYKPTITERRQTIDTLHLYKANNLTLKDAFFHSQLHCIIKTLLTFFLNVHKANASRINPNTHALMHTKHVTVVALVSQITREDQNQSVCVSSLS